MSASKAIRLFMVGDVMLGRAIDMIHPYSCDPKLYEGNGLSALDYVKLAEQTNGSLPDYSERGSDYVWGDAIQILDEKKPDFRLINLETSVTTSTVPWPRKAVHYKMHPKNVSIIQAAKIDCCVLANNHTADWGFEGLNETLSSLEDAGISFVGAGKNAESASAPFVYAIPGKGRVLVFAGGHRSSGVLDEWKAKENAEGLNIVDVDDPSKSVKRLKEEIGRHKKKGDVVVLSIHWGGNWGFDVEGFQKTFARAVIDEAHVDVVYGHSSHHVKGVEVFNRKLIVYSCGDFINDYEGIGGHESYRGDLSLMYFADVDPTNGNLLKLDMVPTELKQLRVNRCRREDDVGWLQNTMSCECRRLGCDIKRVGNELQLVF